MSHDLVQIAITTVLLYTTALVLVRVIGRRTVSQLSAFDALITIAVGGILAGSILDTPPSYLRGTTAIVTLLGLQVLVRFVRRVQHLPSPRRLQTSHCVRARAPRLNTSIFSAQLTDEQIEMALRAASGPIEPVVVVFEPDGTFSVVTK